MILDKFKASYNSASCSDEAGRILYSLISTKPDYYSIVKIGTNTKLALALSRWNEVTPLHVLLQYTKRKKLNRDICEAFENCADTRKLLLFLNEQTGKDRVPYIHKILVHLAKHFGVVISSWNSVSEIASHQNVYRVLKGWSDEVGLKHYSGATNTNVGLYDWIMGDPSARPDLATIKRSDVRIDLGGGYSTFEISKLFGAEFVSYDLINPATASKTIIHNWHDKIKLSDIQSAKWQKFDVMKDGFSDSGKSYSVVSFGFLGSTVGNSGYTHKEVGLAACTRVAELIAFGRPTYCYFYGRPTKRFSRFPIIQLWADNGKIDRIVGFETNFGEYIPGQPDMIWDFAQDK